MRTKIITAVIAALAAAGLALGATAAHAQTSQTHYYGAPATTHYYG